MFKNLNTGIILFNLGDFLLDCILYFCIFFLVVGWGGGGLNGLACSWPGTGVMALLLAALPII
jgi:hypothetical protein